MVNRAASLLLVAAALLLGSSSLCAAGTAGNWTLYEHNPVLGPGLGVIFDVSVLTNPAGSGLPRYSMYNSWRTDNNSRAVDAIGLATSPDGLSWSGQRVVLPPLPSPSSWEHVVNRASVISRGASGAYEMWYTGQTDNESFIGVAYSKDGVQWERRSVDPVLSPASATWEKAAVMCPCVQYDASAPVPYRLWYSGGDQYEPDAIGVAFSTDGLRWVKDRANPVLKPDPSAPWEALKVTGAHVFYDEISGWWYSFYIGFLTEDTASINAARSRDGLTGWQRHPANPLIAHGDADSWLCDAVYKPYVAWEADNSRWLLWFNGRCGDVEAIGVAIHKGHDLGFDHPTHAQGMAPQGRTRHHEAERQ